MIALFEDMIDTSVQETKENLEVMEEGLLELEKDPTNDEVINSVFRAMHTIKGGAGLMGLDEMSKLAHVLENVLDDVREKKLEFTEEISSNLFTGYDLLQQMINEGDLHGESIKEEIETIKSKLKDSVQAETKQTPNNNTIQKQEGSEFYKIHLSFQPTIFETGTDPAMLITELQDVANVLYSIVHTNKLTSFADFDPQQLYISWTIFIETNQPREAIDSIFIFVIDENDITITDITQDAEKWFLGEADAKNWLSEYEYFSDDEIGVTLNKLKEIGQALEKENKLSFNKNKQSNSKPTNRSANQTNNTIRVDTEKLEKILNELAELLIAQSRVKELVLNGLLTNDNQYREIANAFIDVDKIIRNVQEEVMNTSMIPIGLQHLCVSSE